MSQNHADRTKKERNAKRLIGVRCNYRKRRINMSENTNSIRKQAEAFAKEMRYRLPHDILSELIRSIQHLRSHEPDAGMANIAEFVQITVPLINTQGFGMSREEAVKRALVMFEKKRNIERLLILESLEQFKIYGIKRALRYIESINYRLSASKLNRPLLLEVAKKMKKASNIPEALMTYLDIISGGEKFYVIEIASHELESYTGPEYWGGPRTCKYHTTGAYSEGSILLPKKGTYKEKMRTGDLVAISADRRDWDWNGSYHFVNMHFLAHIPWDCPTRKWDK